MTTKHDDLNFSFAERDGEDYRLVYHCAHCGKQITKRVKRSKVPIFLLPLLDAIVQANEGTIPAKLIGERKR